MSAETLGNQLATVGSAPIPFFALLIVCSVFIWGVMLFLFKERIETLKHRLDAKDDELKRAREHPSLAAPRAVDVASPASAAPPAMSDHLWTKPQPELPADRIFLGSSVTPDFLASLFEDKTQFEGDAASKPYKGKWMKVSGLVYDAKDYSSDAQLVINMPLKKGAIVSTGVALTFDSAEKISGYRRGDKVTAVGRLYRAGQHMITLEHCEIVES